MLKTEPDSAALADFLVRAGTQLLSYACPAHRLERALTDVARRFGVETEVFCVPSGMWLSVGQTGQAPVVRIGRVASWAFDLDRLTAVSGICDRVSSGALGLDAALAELTRIRDARPLYGKWLTSLAGGLGSASTAVFFGGGVVEALLGALLGVVLMTADLAIGATTALRALSPFGYAVAATGAAWLACHLDPSLSTGTLVAAGVVLAVPGTSLTVSLAELVHKNLVSGAGRLLDATMVLLSLVFGVVLVTSLVHAGGGTLAFLATTPGSATSLPVLVGAMVAGGLAFGVLVSVPVRHIPAGVAGGVLAGLAADLAQRWLGEVSVAAFCGAFVVSLYANLLARRTGLPSQLYAVPGIILLVPGTFAFFSFGKLLVGDVTGGASGAFQTLLVAAALVTGLVAANVVLPSRRSL